MTGLDIVLALVLMALPPPLHRRSRRGDAAGARRPAAAVRPGRIGSAPTSSAATSSCASCSARASRSPSSRWSPSSWCPSASRSACRPAISAAGIDAVLMRITDIFLAFPRLILALAFAAALGPGHRERRDRHRAHHLAALCAARARRDADAPARRVHRGRRTAGRIASAHHRSPDRAALPLLGDHPPHARHGRHHPDRRRSRLPRPRRAAADAGMGRDGLLRPAGAARPVVGGDHSRASPSSWSASASTCWATACATWRTPASA